VTPNLLVANLNAPFNDVRGLIAYAKANPGKLNYATAGNGSSNHLCFELFKTMTGTQVTHVPYKGSAPAVTDLIAGNVQVMFDNTPNVLPHVRGGRIKALAVSTKARAGQTPEVATVDESGVPGFDVGVWFSVLTVAGTSPEVVKRQCRNHKNIELSEVKGRFAKMGVEGRGWHARAVPALPEQRWRWADVIRSRTSGRTMARKRSRSSPTSPGRRPTGSSSAARTCRTRSSAISPRRHGLSELVGRSQ
jgi:tripartite-type tricarboxylate transporter receptor subunit TctC